MKHLKSYGDFVNEKFSDKVKDAYSSVKQKVKDFSLKGLYHDTVDFTKNFWEATKREGKETKQALIILRKMIKGHEVSDKEKAFFKKQAGDIAKIFPLIAIQGIPGGSVAITPLLKTIGKKYNFEPFPSANDKLDDEHSKENKIEN